MYKNDNNQRKSGYEDTLPLLSTSKNINPNPTLAQDTLDRSIRRTKQLISDVVLCNQFDLFATFTFKDNRQDINFCKNRMSNWLKSQQKQYGKFKYIIVPEFHKDKKSIHFHALFKNYRGQLSNSAKLTNSRQTFNIQSYRSGFSTAVKIDNMDAVSQYIKKYITKDMPTFGNKKRYWLSTGLNRPYTLLNQDFFHKYSMDWGIIHNTEYFTIYESNEIIPLSS